MPITEARSANERLIGQLLDTVFSWELQFPIFTVRYFSFTDTSQVVWIVNKSVSISKVNGQPTYYIANLTAMLLIYYNKNCKF